MTSKLEVYEGIYEHEVKLNVELIKKDEEPFDFLGKGVEVEKVIRYTKNIAIKVYKRERDNLRVINKYKDVQALKLKGFAKIIATLEHGEYFYIMQEYVHLELDDVSVEMFITFVNSLMDVIKFFNIYDLHSGNMGIIDGEIVILDWGQFSNTSGFLTVGDRILKFEDLITYPSHKWLKKNVDKYLEDYNKNKEQLLMKEVF